MPAGHGQNDAIMITQASRASYQIRNIAGCACAENAGNVYPPPQINDPDMYRFPLKSVLGGNVPGIPGAYATRNFAYLVRGPLRGM